MISSVISNNSYITAINQSRFDIIKRQLEQVANGFGMEANDRDETASIESKSKHETDERTCVGQRLSVFSMHLQILFSEVDSEKPSDKHCL